MVAKFRIRQPGNVFSGKQIGKLHDNADMAIKMAQRFAKQRKETMDVYIAYPNGQRSDLICTAWPDGWCDLTWAGSELV